VRFTAYLSAAEGPRFWNRILQPWHWHELFARGSSVSQRSNKRSHAKRDLASCAIDISNNRCI